MEAKTVTAEAEFARRLQQLCDRKGLPRKGKGRINALQALLAGQGVNCSVSRAGHWLAGRTRPSVESCYALAKALGVEFEWLYAGIGPTLKVASMSPEHRRWMAAYSTIPEEVRQLVLVLAEKNKS